MSTIEYDILTGTALDASGVTAKLKISTMLSELLTDQAGIQQLSSEHKPDHQRDGTDHGEYKTEIKNNSDLPEFR